MTTWTDSYRNEMDGVSLTDEKKAHMAAQLAEQAAGTDTAAEGGEVLAFKPKARSHKPHRLAAAAVAAGLVLTVGLGGYAYASGQLVSVAELVQEAFGNGPAKTEIVDKVGRPVDASVTHDGVTVSADAIMGDDHSYVVVYSIQRTDGKPLADLAEGSGTQQGDYTCLLSDGRWLIPELDQTVDGATAQGGAQWIYDADPSDNALQVVVAYGTDTNVIGRTVHATFSGFTASDDAGGSEDLLTGTWDLSFKLNYESDAVTLQGGQRITLPETKSKATLGTVSVSAVGVTVDYTADATDTDDIPEDQPDGYWDGPTLLDVGNIVVTLKDGTQFTVDGTGGSSRNNLLGTTDCRVTNFFDRVIDPADVASVTLCGTTLNVQ